MKIVDYLNKDIECSCGKKHCCYIDDIVVKDFAIEELTNIINRKKYNNIQLVADINTWKVAGERTKKAIELSGIKYDTYIYQEQSLIPDEKSIGELFVNVQSNTDLIIGIGSGTINDLCKLVSDRMKTDYCIVATAPSMDGFASNVSPLILDNLKTTIPTKIPNIIIGDLKILSNAPKEMITAGIGDILGKYVCLTDWKLANLINNEYHCEYVENIVKKSIEIVVDIINKNSEAIDNNFLCEKETIAAIMEGLILSGIAMSYIGNSRPASGSEHHLSHFWEMMFLFLGKKSILHGTKVAIGTLEAIRLYEKLITYDLDYKKIIDDTHFVKEKWEEEINKVYGKAAPAIIDLENECKKNSDIEVKRRLISLEKNQDKIFEIIKELPKSTQIEEYLKRMDAPCCIEDIGVDDDMLKNSIKYAKELRNRYGLLQLLFDTGIK